jgi:beta-phosphoglucomutase
MIRGKASLLPGVADLLKGFQVRGCRQAIGSSAPQENIDQLVDELNIRDFFQEILATKGIPGKPDPEIFLQSARAIGVDPSRCLVIEDALPGIEAAHRGGMHCLAVATTHPVGDLTAADKAVYRLNEISPEEAIKMVDSQGDGYER